MIRGGYYIKARRIQESKIAKAPPHIREIWDWLLKEANHQDNHICKRGQCVRTYKDIREGLNWYIGWRKMMYSKWHCEIAMKWLKKATMITTTKTTRGILISIVNYSKYQDPSNYESHKVATTNTTREPQTTATINKNGKEYKELKNNPKGLGKPVYGNPLVNRFLEYLKEKAEVIDTPVKFQRTDSWILIRKMKSLAKDKQGREPTDDEVMNGLKFLVDTACADKFHCQRVGKIRYLYENIGVIVKSVQSKQRKIII